MPSPALLNCVCIRVKNSDEMTVGLVQYDPFCAFLETRAEIDAKSYNYH